MTAADLARKAMAYDLLAADFAKHAASKYPEVKKFGEMGLRYMAEADAKVTLGSAVGGLPSEEMRNEES